MNPHDVASELVDPVRWVYERDGIMEFHVIGPKDDHPVVKAWTSRRVPFEPKGAMRDLRGEIREAIGKIRPSFPSFCYATYCSLDTSLCDVENVLFFNIDTGSRTFRHIAKAGYCFERLFASPSLPDELLDFEPRHHYFYEATTDATWRYWQQDKLIGRSEATIKRGQIKVERVCWSLRRGVQNIGNACSTPPDRFGLHVQVRGLELRSTTTMKCLLDGIVSAFHAHDGSCIELVRGRLAARLGVAPELIERALMEDRQACLGRRRLIGVWGDGLQWNPADDRCVAATVSVLPGDPTSDVQIQAELFAVSECAAHLG